MPNARRSSELAEEGTGRPVALVTAAGSGIGAASAARLARGGWDVGLLGRRAEPPREVAATVAGLGGRGEVLVADLAEPTAPPTEVRPLDYR